MGGQEQERVVSPLPFSCVLAHTSPSYILYIFYTFQLARYFVEFVAPNLLACHNISNYCRADDWPHCMWGFFYSEVVEISCPMSHFFPLHHTDSIPADLKDPFYTDQYEQEHLKPPVTSLLLSADLYCRAGSLVLKSLSLIHI